MDFLFSNPVNRDFVIGNIWDDSLNILRASASPTYVVYKSKNANGHNMIKDYLKTNIYDKETTVNPYIKLIKDFYTPPGVEGCGLKIQASHLAYLRDLGVYPINRMVILRKFPEGVFITENLGEMKVEPISTVIGWIPTDKPFSTISVNEGWSTMPERMDQVIAEIIKKNTGIDLNKAIPIPDFTQGMLYEFYKRMGLTNTGANTALSVDESYEFYNPGLGATTKEEGGGQPWGLNHIPIGDPNVLQEGPFRDPVGQNIKSDFQFSFETVYEQKMIGDIDPGSAMLDCLENLYAMGTSNMAFYWGDGAPIIAEFIAAATGEANKLDSWWVLVKDLTEKFWDTLTELFKAAKTKLLETVQQVQQTATTQNAKAAAAQQVQQTATTQNAKAAAATLGQTILTDIEKLLPSILTSTVAIHRFKLRGSIELMVGGKMSAAPWHITIGNPYSPWINTNHIIVKSVTIDTSTEMGFNDQPQWIKANITCSFSRALGKQELMRMFNNTYRRNYDAPGLASRRATTEFNNQHPLTLMKGRGVGSVSSDRGGLLTNVPLAGLNVPPKGGGLVTSNITTAAPGLILK